MDEGLTVHALRRVLRRSLHVVVAIPVVFILMVSTLLLVSNPRYSSQAAVGLSVSSQQLSSQQVSAQLLSNLPNPASLALTFSQTIATSEMAAALGAGSSVSDYEASFDERKALLTLRARGRTAVEARSRAENLLRVAQEHFKRRLVAAATGNLASALAQTQLDLSTARKGLADIQKLLASPPRQTLPISPAASAAMEAQKVDPQWARSANPAYAYLSLQEAQLQSQLVQSQARAESLEEIQKDQQALASLVGQSLQVQVIAPPSTPIRPDFPRPARELAFAAVAGFLVAFAVAFFRDAWLGPDQSPTA